MRVADRTTCERTDISAMSLSALNGLRKNLLMTVYGAIWPACVVPNGGREAGVDLQPELYPGVASPDA